MDNPFSAIKHKFFIYLPGLLAGICLLGIGIYIDRLNINAKQQDQYNLLANQVGALRARIEGNINSHAQVIKGLVAAISIEPNMSLQRFIDLSTPLLEGRSQIRNIAAAPNLVIRYMNPVAGNEAAIGVDYRTIPAQYEIVKLAQTTGELILDGPVNLVQGGKGFIVRVPVYTKSSNNRAPEFWGMLASVIDIDRFFSASGLYDTHLEFNIAIRKKSIRDSSITPIFGDQNIFNADPVLSNITLPYGSWQLAAIPQQGWLRNHDTLTAFRATLFGVGLFILIPIFILSRSMEKQKESDALLRSLFTLSPIGIALNDYTTGHFVKINNALLQNSGYTAHEFMKLGFRDIFQNNKNKIETAAFESLEQTGHYGPYEAEFVRKDSSKYPVVLKGILLHDFTGKKMICSFAEDISKRKHAEKLLQRSQKMDAMGQLTGGIAHDFNNILNIILGNLELLKHGLAGTSETNLKRIDSIHNAGQRAADLTKQLLSFSRFKPSKQEVTNINDIVEKMENLITRSMTPEIAVTNQFENNLWLTMIDRGDMEDALLNLCFNARDAITAHGKIIISTRNVTIDAIFSEHASNASEGEYVELTVMDNGIGIPAEQQEHIFEPFYTTKSEGKGTGLGLSMVYGFVQRSGGFIDVKSSTDAGTSIKLYLPRYNGPGCMPAQDNNHKSTSLPCGTETLLIVDDEVALLEIATSLLERLGYTVYTATNGEQAWQRLHQKPAINLVFSDVVMPGKLNGYELAGRVHAEFPEIKILLTSGYIGKILANTPHPENASIAAIKILNKPYSTKELAISIREILDQ